MAQSDPWRRTPPPSLLFKGWPWSSLSFQPTAARTETVGTIRPNGGLILQPSSVSEAISPLPKITKFCPKSAIVGPNFKGLDLFNYHQYIRIILSIEFFGIYVILKLAISTNMLVWILSTYLGRYIEYIEFRHSINSELDYLPNWHWNVFLFFKD